MKTPIKSHYCLAFSTTLVISFASGVHADSTASQTPIDDIMVSELDDMQGFAATQYANLLERLESESSLQDHHNQLVAKALSKDLEGLPLCTLSQEIVYHEETDRSETRLVTVNDNGFLTDDHGRNRFYNEWKYSPFSAPPAVGMDFSSAKLIEESESELTIQFRFDKKAQSPSENITELLGDLGRVAKNLRYTLVIDFGTGAPKSLVLELTKKTRVMIVASVKKIRHEYIYEFDENMQRFIVPKQSVEYAYSAPTRGTVEEKIDVTYSNFECPTPIKYVWRDSSTATEDSTSSLNP